MHQIKLNLGDRTFVLAIELPEEAVITDFRIIPNLNSFTGEKETTTDKVHKWLLINTDYILSTTYTIEGVEHKIIRTIKIEV